MLELLGLTERERTALLLELLLTVDPLRVLTEVPELLRTALLLRTVAVLLRTPELLLRTALVLLRVAVLRTPVVVLRVASLLLRTRVPERVPITRPVELLRVAPLRTAVLLLLRTLVELVRVRTDERAPSVPAMPLPPLRVKLE